MKLIMKIYQQFLKLYVAAFKIKETRIIHEPGASVDMGERIKADGISRVLVITDGVLTKLGLPVKMLEGLKESGVAYTVYDGVVQNPTIENIEAAKQLYLDNQCEAIVAFGGGSVIDCAKMTGVVALSGKPVKRYDRMIPMIRKMARLYAVPTTAGTGSEVTISAVITDTSRHKKMAITDPKLAPDVAVLDAELMIGLPKPITAATGMDALTHAVEAYVGNWKFKSTDTYAVKAVKKIFGYIEKAYKKGDNIEARHEMAIGAAYGGYAFRTAGVGYVHGIAHRLSELYGIPHGLANAMVLPHVLWKSIDSIDRKLADLSKKAELADWKKSDREIAEDFIRQIEALNEKLLIPKYVSQIRRVDIPLIAKRAIGEANKMYPVPYVMFKKELMAFIETLRPPYGQPEKENAEMLKERIITTVNSQYDYFKSGATLSYKTRKANLKRFKKAIQAYESRIADALKVDLGKSAFEAYATETSLVYSEINHAVKHLRKWMKTKRVPTPIASFGGVSKIYQQPKGVVLVISPWNYPFMLALSPVIAAIAAGNCITVKPSSYSQHTSQVIEDLMKETFDSAYISVFQGNRDINAILLEQKFDHVFFTGSTTVGRIVMQSAADKLTPVTLELGGKSPCIVDKNADIKKAAKRIIWGKSINSGQTCVAPDYVLVHAEVKDQLVKEMIASKKQFFGEKTIDSDDFGKIIRPQAFERLTGLIKGQNILYGGGSNKRKQKIELTLLDEPALDADVMQNEIFGPILPIVSVKDMNETFEIIRQYEKPLALYLFTKDRAFERKMIAEIHFGGGCVNDTVMHLANDDLPFGGIGASGLGSYHADKGFETFSHAKSVLRQNFLFDVPIRYAPYKNKLKLLKQIIK